MHVKYRQDNLHRITWYTDTCGSNGHGLTIYVNFMVKYVHYVRASHSLYLLHMNSVILGKNVVLNMLTK
jgi:hypothetical protein